MEPQDLIGQAKRIISATRQISAKGVLTEAKEFLRVYAGEKSSFFVHLKELTPFQEERYLAGHIVYALEAFIRYVENDLIDGVSIIRDAKITVVSDILIQADTLLDDNKVHPAAPTMVIGASLEEFLRSWAEEAELEIQGKQGIDSYAKALRAEELITKQDIKDITSWAGLRNHAAHGEWGEVNDRKRIANMLEGVNLFMRKHGAD